MEILGLKSEVMAGNKRFLVQTNYSSSAEQFISTISDSDKQIIKKEIEFEKEASLDLLKETMNSIHREMVSEMEMLFYISDKVKTIKHPVSNNKLGMVFLKRNLIDEAILEFKIAIELDPNFAEAYNNLGLAYLLQENYKDAIDIFNQGIEKNAKYADLFNNLGYAYYELGEYSSAIANLNKSLEINRDYAEAHFNLGQVLLKAIVEGIEGEDIPTPDECKNLALEHLMTAGELMPSKNLTYFETIYEHIGNDDIQPTFDLLDIIKAGSHDRFKIDFENEFYLKFMFGGKGKDDEFIANYSDVLLKAIEDNPKYADLHNNLGIVNLIQCRNLFLKALDEFRQAIKVNPSFKKAEKNLKLAENDGKGFLILLRAILK
ncbi:tetratricopeptide repeat protein [candidate division KSB1 bacterium]|nr:tetratricopeptide repeat protein [candidate division KSB1 bacterium]